MAQHELPSEKALARVAAGTSLTIAAGHASKALDGFASWFLAAFAAGLALAVSQLKEVSAFIPPSTIAFAAYLFLAATIMCVVERYISVIVVSGARAGKEGREMGEKLQNLDAHEFFEQMIRGMPWGARGMCKKQFEAVAGGDFAVTGRFMMRLVVLQGIAVTIELVLLLVALINIVNEIRA